MAAGCIPIIRKSFNGPWVDIIEKGKYGYGYDTLYELVKIINNIIANVSTSINLKFLEKRSLEFSEERFEKELLNYLKTLV